MKKITIGNPFLIFLWIFLSIHFFIHAINQPDPIGATPLENNFGLILPSITTRDQLFKVESENIEISSLKYFSVKKSPVVWFNEKTLQKIHLEMFGEVWDWAGEYYQGPLRNIGVKSSEIPIQMHLFCREIQKCLKERSSLTFLEQSARILHRIQYIHPFTNGNGRLARFVANLYLYSLHGKIARWPEQEISNEGKARDEYVYALKHADQGNYSFLEDLIVKYGGRNPTTFTLFNQPFFERNFSRSQLKELIVNLAYFESRVHGAFAHGTYPILLSIHKKIAEIALLLMDRREQNFDPENKLFTLKSKNSIDHNNKKIYQ